MSRFTFKTSRIFALTVSGEEFLPPEAPFFRQHVPLSASDRLMGWTPPSFNHSHVSVLGFSRVFIKSCSGCGFSSVNPVAVILDIYTITSLLNNQSAGISGTFWTTMTAQFTHNPSGDQRSLGTPFSKQKYYISVLNTTAYFTLPLDLIYPESVRQLFLAFFKPQEAWGPLRSWEGSVVSILCSHMCHSIEGIWQRCRYSFGANSGHLKHRLWLI